MPDLNALHFYLPSFQIWANNIVFFDDLFSKYGEYKIIISLKMLKLKRGKFLKRKKMMSLDSPEDDGVNDPTKPSQEVIKHDTTAAADLAVDTTLNSEDDKDVQDKKKAGEKRSFPWTPHLRTKESSTQRGRHLSLSGTSPLRELTIKLCR